MTYTLTTPAIMTQPWASVASGTRGTVNSISQASASPNASLADGFPTITMTNPSSGGVAPAGGDFNGILNWITTFQNWVNAGQMFQWSATLLTNLTGGTYPQGTVLMSTSLGQVYLATAAQANNPDSTMTGWQYAYGNIVGTGASQTPSSALAGTLYYNSSNGAVLQGRAGSGNDWSLLTPLGSGVAWVPTGTKNFVVGGAIFPGSIQTGAIGAGSAGGVYVYSNWGLTLQATTGGAYDFQLMNPTGASAILSVPTGTLNVNFAGKQNLAQVANASPTLNDVWMDSTQQTLCTAEGVSGNPLKLYKSGVMASGSSGGTLTTASSFYSVLATNFSGIGTCTLPASFLKTNKMIKIEMWVQIDNTTTAAYTFKLYVQGSAVTQCLFVTPSITALNVFSAKVEFIIIANTPGYIQASCGYFGQNNGTAVSSAISSVSETAVTWTSSALLDVQASASAGTSMGVAVQEVIISVLG